MAIAKPEWRTNPEMVSISVRKDQIRRSPLGNEIVINRDIDGESKTAVVPAHAFNETTGKVVAAIVGDAGDSVLLSFPPSSSGTSTWVVSKSLIEKVVAG